jgi:HEAT repeat protein
MNTSRPHLSLSPEERQRIEEIDRLLASPGASAAQALAERLDDPSWAVRRAVVGSLAALGEDGVPALMAVLNGDRRDESRLAAAVEALVLSSGAVERALEPLATAADPALVSDVAHVLGRRRRQASVPSLVKLTRHPNDNVAVAAIEGLGRMGGRAAVEALLEALASGNFFRTFPAIDVLGRTGDPRVVAPLAALLDNRHYSLEAARALGRTGDKAAVAPLAARLTVTSNADVRVAAAALVSLHAEYTSRYGLSASIEEILRRSVDRRAATRRLGQALSGADPAETAAISTVLGILGEESAAPLLLPLLLAPAPVGPAANRAVKNLGRQADAMLVSALVEADGPGRKALLPLMSSAQAVNAVMACLDDEDPEVRAAACEALARMGGRSANAALFHRLGDANALVVQSAMSAIQSLGSSDTAQLALAAAGDPSPSVRRWALRIIAYFGFPQAVDTLLERAADPDPRVRDSALYALSFLENRRAHEALLTASRDADPGIRAAAMRAFAQSTGDARAMAAVLRGLDDPDAWVRYYACQSAGRLRIGQGIDNIARLLGDPAGQVRVAAVEALSHFEDRRARQALTRAVSSSEDDVKRAALIGIGIAQATEAMAEVVAAVRASDPATRLVALSALASLDDPRVIDVLLDAAEDDDESVRNAAIGSLALRPVPDATRALIGLLESGRNLPSVQQALAIPSPERITEILLALESADDDLAPLLTSALARMVDSAASAALVRALSLPNVAARKAAAATLGALGSREAVTALKAAAAADPHLEVRKICAVVLS